MRHKRRRDEVRVEERRRREDIDTKAGRSNCSKKKMREAEDRERDGRIRLNVFIQKYQLGRSK